LGCGLRRKEAAERDVAHLQRRENHWAIVDLVGEGRQIRTIPVPDWVKTAVDSWLASADVSDGRVFRCVCRAGGTWGNGVTERNLGVANHFGYGPFTVIPLSHHNEPLMPGERTCSGGVSMFQIPGPLSAQENVAIPVKVHHAASIRCVFAYVQQQTTDGQSAYVVKYSADGGATWNILEKMGIAQILPGGAKTTHNFLVSQSCEQPETRRLHTPTTGWSA
jgi:hypothetical protein